MKRLFLSTQIGRNRLERNKEQKRMCDKAMNRDNNKTKHPKEYCSILNTNISVTDMEKTKTFLEEELEALRGDYICVSNVHTTVMASRDPYYQMIQNSGAMAVPDGQPLSIVSRQRGYANAQRVPGPDLMIEMLAESEKKGYRNYFYGGEETTLQAMKKVILQKYPNLQIAGMYSPPFRELTKEEDEKIVRMINDAKPDYIWVALGAPKQEIWMYEHRGRLNGVCLGVGAAFGFTAGTTKRAPDWMQKLCLEWFFRIWQDPKRLIPRYVNTNFSFLLHVWKENRKIKREKKG